MFPSVQSAFVPFNQPLEGVVPWMYADQENLITTGMGNLIDPVGAALSLPWTHGDGGAPATQEEIQAAFDTVKNAGVAGTGGGNQGNLTDLRLSQDAINSLVASKLQQFEGTIASSFPTWSQLFADAQLAMLSMAWAMGPAFAAHFPSFTSAINQADFQTAALQSWMRDASDWVPTSLDDDPSAHPPNQNAGLRPRNLLNRQLLLNAAAQQASGADPSQLVWSAGWMPTSLTSVVASGAAVVTGHPIFALLGLAAVAGGGLAIAQQAGIVRAISPAFDKKLVSAGKTLALPFQTAGKAFSKTGPGSEIDSWIHRATGRKVEG